MLSAVLKALKSIERTLKKVDNIPPYLKTPSFFMELIMSIGKYFKDAVAVATNPAQFYREMPRSGGLIEPVLYVLAMAVVAVLLCAVGAIFDAETRFFGTLFGHLIPHVVKVFVVIAVATVALYFLWQRLGSSQSFEVSARAVTYLAVFSPIWIMLGGFEGVLGLVFKVIAIGWLIAALVAASSEVHAVDKQSALMSFIGLAILLALFSYLSDDDTKNESTITDERTVSEKTVSELALGDAAKEPYESFGVKASEDEQSTLDKMLDESAESLRMSSSQAKDHKASSLAVEGILGVEPAVEKNSALGVLEDYREEGVIENSVKELALEKDAGIEEGIDHAESVGLEEKAEQAGEILGNLVNGFDESVEKVGEQLALAAKDFQQGLDQVQGSVTEPEGAVTPAKSMADVAVAAQPEAANSIAESAGAALGTMIEGVGDIVEGVQEGFQKAAEDQAPESPEALPKSNELMTPEQLGVAMAEFMRGVDQAAEKSAESMEDISESAVEALNRFIQSYQKALEEGKAE